jgi:hypothetical protein
MSKPAQCRDCGSTDVEWRQNKAGKWFLAELTRGARGSVYSTGPHFAACSVRGPRAERLQAIAAHNAEVEAARAKEAAESAEINARMLEMIKAGMSSEEIVAIIYSEKGSK